MALRVNRKAAFVYIMIKINKNNFLYLFNETKKAFKNRTAPLSKPKRIILYILMALVAALSIPSSLSFGDAVCNHYSFIGAIQKAPATFYTVYTFYALIYNLLNYNLFKVKEDTNINKILLIITRLMPIYILDLALAVCYVYIPIIKYMCYTDISLFWLIPTFPVLLILPLLPMALSVFFAFIPEIKSKKYANILNIMLLLVFCVTAYLFGDIVLQKLSDNAYTLSMGFTKYYFPAALFESLITNGTGGVLFVATNISASCLSMLALSKINKL